MILVVFAALFLVAGFLCGRAYTKDGDRWPWNE